jgi:hypothetical protein
LPHFIRDYGNFFPAVLQGSILGVIVLKLADSRTFYDLRATLRFLHLIVLPAAYLADFLGRTIEKPDRDEQIITVVLKRRLRNQYL